MAEGVRACELPEEALLRRYLVAGGYADCYVAEVAGRVEHAAYVEAFYTSSVFKVERWLLARLIARPSTDAEARELARGQRETFAAWKVEARAPGQVLLAALGERTRSWLMCVAPGGVGTTWLFFGSAVVPRVDRRTGERRLGRTYRALLGFHKLYSRVLLGAAVRRLARVSVEPERS
jgi:hypothetical protein